MFDYALFKDPPSEYRSAPFWSWNGKLEEDELRSQIRAMREQGMGGFFMHPRGGMRDAYMGASYMEAVRVCVDEAAKLGMKAWLYDEDRFPSGGAGGLLTKDNERYAALALDMRVIPAQNIGELHGRLRVFLNDDGLFTDITGKPEAEMAALGRDVVVFAAAPLERSALWNNERYGDLLSADAVGRFIELTHEKYKEAFGAHFGGVIPGIFTDEPSVDVRRRGGSPRIAWTERLSDEFLSRKGYSLLDNVYKLFYDIGDYRKTRYDYWDVVSALFTENFTVQTERWCAGNNMRFTGHFWEHVFPNPAYTGSVMPNYAHMQYPGIDMLFNTEEETVQYGNVLIVKELSSVKNQLGKERTLSETHGASGWDLNFTDQKRFLDWQFVLGVDFVCQHLLHYSMEGFRKRDFPLSFTYQPWWDEYKLLGDYIGRLSYVLAQGRAAADILVLHPSLSTYAAFSPNGESVELSAIGRSAKWLCRALCETRFYYDLGDEVIMAEHAAVDGASLRVGHMRYTTVLMPSMTNMAASTFELLKAFSQSGGVIIATGDTPHMLEGAENQDVASFFAGTAVKRVTPDKAALEGALAALNNARCALTKEAGKDISDVYCCERALDGHTALFIANTGKTGTFNVRVPMKDGAYVERLDCLTGERLPLALERDGDGCYARLTLSPVESHLLLIDAARAAEPAAAPAAKPPKTTARIDAARFEVTRLDPNALTIQTVRYRIDGGAWSDVMNVVAAFDAVRDAMGLERGTIFTRQPWMFTGEDYKKTVKLEAEYVFNSQFAPACIQAAIERPDICDVYVNGHAAAPNGGHYVTRDFKTFDIAPFIKQGANSILLRYDAFDIDSVLESVYIIGDFAVTNDNGTYTLAREGRIPAGDWTEAGYPFYSGAMLYRAAFNVNAAYEKVDMSLDGLYGVASVAINGRRAATLAFPPYTAEITDFVRAGENTVEIRVMNSLQNLLGPHHTRGKGIVTPGSFYLDGAPSFFDRSGFMGALTLNVR